MNCFFALFNQSETACANASPWNATNSASLRKSSTQLLKEISVLDIGLDHFAAALAE
jgi:hypothetical protein